MNSSPFIILIVAGIYGLVHSLLASLGAKARARRCLGPAASRVYRLVYNLLALILMLPLLVLSAALPDHRLYAVPFPWAALMLAGQAAAAGALVVGLLQTGLWSFLGIRQLLQVEEERPALVISGLYRQVRHPLYTAGLVFMWLTPLMTANLLALYASLTMYIFSGAWYEERKLRQEFGDAYAAYQQRTPMFIPSLKKNS
jgi:methanethiol S-methyltransferase